MRELHTVESHSDMNFMNGKSEPEEQPTIGNRQEF